MVVNGRAVKYIIGVIDNGLLIHRINTNDARVYVSRIRGSTATRPVWVNIYSSDDYPYRNYFNFSGNRYFLSECRAV